jgi:hypothetical protein
MLNKNVIIVLVISALLIFYNFQLSIKQKEINELQEQNFKLDEKIKSLIKLNGNKIQVIYKDREKIKYIIKYLPPESSIEIITDDDGDIDIKYRWAGVGIWPFLGVGYSDEIRPIFGARFLYISRFGVGALTTFNGISIFADVRTDLRMFQNSSFGIFYDNNKNLGLSIHTFF